MEGKTAYKALAAIRIVLGWGFLFAGLSKFLMIGMDKPFTSAGFLKFGTAGSWPGVAAAAEGAPPVVVNPTQEIWVALAGNATALSIVDFFVVFGQIAIGAALILGLFTRFAALMGALQMSLLTIAAWDFGHGIVNQTSLYVVLGLALAYAHAGRAYGLDGIIERTAFVRENAIVRRFAGVLA
jgi:thiosulfate dehydrogenase [quinone] large subunit